MTPTEKALKIYQLYAERHPDYGRTHYGYFLSFKEAEEVKEKMFAKIFKKGDETQDGYFESDWNIEIYDNEVIDIVIRETKIKMNQQISERLTKLEVENRELKSQLKW